MSFKKRCIFSTLPRTERGRFVTLKGDPKGKNFLYTNGKCVVIRDIEDPGVSDVYLEHATDASVACYAPSGFYIASGDASGKIRIWDTTNEEHLLKYEYQPLGGKVKDIAWSPDSKRIVVGGEGRDKFANVFLWDTGSSVGNVHYHSKSVNAVDFKSTRPYRVVTASEDTTVSFFEGPPFKFTSSIKDHNKFVNAVRFSPDGELFITGCAGGKMFIFDGKTAGQIGQLQDGESAHDGQVNAISWSSDCSHILSASGDKTAKIWDVATQSLVTTFKFGDSIDHQHLGCLWQGNHLLTVTLDGHINYLDRNDPAKPLKVLQGHNKNITSFDMSSDKSTLFTGSFDGLVNYWDVNTGVCNKYGGTFHSNQVSEFVIRDNDLVSCGMDDKVRYGSVDAKAYTSDVIGLESEPKGIAVGADGLAVVACVKEVVVIRNKHVVYTTKVSYYPQCVCINASGTEVAVGGDAENMNVHIYTLDQDTLIEKTKIVTNGQISVLQYSPDGEHLAVGTNRRVNIYKTDSFEVVIDSWSAHTARVTCLDWASDSTRIVSGGIDSNIFVWDMKDTFKKIALLRAHPVSIITRIKWLSDTSFVSVGTDCCIRIWDQA